MGARGGWSVITRRRILSVLAAAPACSAFPAAAEERLQTVATFSILGDFVRQVGGDKVAVTSLVGPDGDAHTFEPSPRDGKTLAAARLVIANGLGFDNWVTRLINASRTRAQVVVATRGVAPIQGVGENRGKDDPHAWQSVANAKIYVSNIRGRTDRRRRRFSGCLPQECDRLSRKARRVGRRGPSGDCEDSASPAARHHQA